jgi:transcriptional regulator with XRE-family HTH domain
MTKLKRVELSIEAHRRNLEMLARLGGELRMARNRRRLTQRDVAGAVGLSRSTVGAIERGHGGGHTMDTWQRLGLAAGRPLRVELERDRAGETDDAGHLAVQELLLRLARSGGWAGTFELPVGRGDGRHSVDVGLRHDRLRVLAWCECWNTINDLGAAARASAWKVRKAEELAIVLGGDWPYRAAACWILRATRRNQALAQRYPEIFASRFPGSSVRWIHAITTGADPPMEAGLVWCDAQAGRLYAWRRR